MVQANRENDKDKSYDNPVFTITLDDVSEVSSLSIKITYY